MKSNLRPTKGFKLPPVPRADPKWKRRSAVEIERMLRADGFKPTDRATKRQLIASGNWDMPEE